MKFDQMQVRTRCTAAPAGKQIQRRRESMKFDQMQVRTRCTAAPDRGCCR